MKTEGETPVQDSTEAHAADVEAISAEELPQALGDKLAGLIADDTEEPDASAKYHEREGGFAFMIERKDKDGDTESVPKRFTNFIAEIEEVRHIDSGFVNSHGILETDTVYILKGVLEAEKPLPRITLRAREFFTNRSLQTAWPGIRLDVHTRNVEDHLRDAIIECSAPLKERHVYRHTGWKQIEDGWTYLHASGGINATGLNPDVETALPDRLQQVELPAPLLPGPELRADVQAVLRVLDVAPDRVTVPLLAAVHRSILGSLLPITYSVFLAGPTGAMKSSLADLVQSFWGLDFLHQRPENWSSTANRIEKMCFEAKDMVLLIDDYKPGITARERSEMHEKAHRIFQNAGNRVGRGRDTASGEDRQTRYSRSLALATGEEAPKSESTVARLLLLHLAPGEVDTKILTEAQEAGAGGIFSHHLSSFVRSVADQYATLQHTLKKRNEALRVEARKQDLEHTRLPDTVASLALGWEMFADFIEGIGATTHEETHALRRRGWAALVEAATQQGNTQRQEQPAVLFMTYLRSAIASGLAHLTNAEGDAPLPPAQWGWRRDPRSEELDVYVPQGRRVGWTKHTSLQGDLVFLDPSAAYTIVERVARDHGAVFPVSKDALVSALDDAGLLAKKNKGNRTVTARCCGQAQRVLCLRKADFSISAG